MKIVFLPVSLSTIKPFPFYATSLLISNNHPGLTYISSKTSNKDTNCSSFLAFLQSDRKFLDVKGSLCSLHNYQLIFFLWESTPTVCNLYFSQIKVWSKLKSKVLFATNDGNFVHSDCLLETQGETLPSSKIHLLTEGCKFDVYLNVKMSNINTHGWCFSSSTIFS